MSYATRRSNPVYYWGGLFVPGVNVNKGNFEDAQDSWKNSKALEMPILKATGVAEQNRVYPVQQNTKRLSDL